MNRSACSRRAALRTLVALAVALHLPLVHAQIIDATWLGGPGQWSDPTSWNTNPLVPDNGVDDFRVFITAPTSEVEVDGTFTISALNWAGGAIVGTGTLNVGGPTAITGATDKQFAAATINLNGATVWDGGQIQSVDPPEGGVVNNAGDFDVQFDAFWSWVATQIPVFNNLAGATLTKSAGTFDATFWPQVNNAGTVRVQSGELNLAGGGSSSGSFLVDAGALLTFSDFSEGFSGAGAGTTTLGVDSVIDSDGTVLFSNFGVGGSTRADLFGTIDSPLVRSDPGVDGVVFFHNGASYGQTARGDLETFTGATVFDFASASVNDLTVNADSLLAVDGGILINGTIAVNGTGVIKLGDNIAMTGGDLILDGGAQSLTGDGEIRLEGGGSSSVGSPLSNLTIGANMSIRGLGNVGAGVNQGTITSDLPTRFIRTDGLANSASIEGVGGGSIEYKNAINSGTVAVAGGGTLLTQNIDNRGVLAINGGSLEFRGNSWTNSNPAGVVNATNASVILKDDFAFTDVGVINRTNSDIFLQGTLQNTAQTLNLDNSTGARGTWIMNGSTFARIVGGSVQTSGGATLIFRGTTAGILQGVTLNSAPLFENGTGILVSSGLTLNNVTLDMSVAGTGAAGIAFTEAGPRFINGTGTIVLGNQDNRGIDNSFGSQATIGAGVTIRGNRGRLLGGTNGILLQGKVSADVAAGFVNLIDVTVAPGGIAEAKNGGRIQLSGNWDNNGVANVENNSTLDLAGTFDTPDVGVITRTGTTTVQLFGTLTNTAQTLNLHTTTGTLLLRSGGTIVGGAVTSSGSSSLQVLGTDIAGPILDGVSLGANLAFVGGGSGGALTVRNGLTFTGGATVDLGGLGRALNFTGSAPQTVGGTGTILLNSGAGSNLIRNSMGGGGAVTIGPNVTVRGSGFSLSIDGNFSGGAGGISNQGTIRAEGAGTAMSLSRVSNAGGTIRVDPGASLTINNSFGSTSFVQTGGDLSIGGTATSSALVSLQGGELSGTGSLRVNGTAANARVQAGTGGTIAPGDSIGTLTVDGDVILAAGGRFAVEISGASSADRLNIVKGAFQNAAGNFDLSTLADFLDVSVLGSAVVGNDYLVATYAGTLTGTFDNVTAGMSVIYDTPNKRIFVRPTSLPGVSGDADGDLDVDGNDFLIWQRNLGTTVGATPAVGSFDGDGDVDSGDLAIWRTNFGTTPAIPAAAPVPEPSATVLTLTLIATSMASRKRKRPE